MTQDKMIEVLQNKLDAIRLERALILEELQYKKYIIWFLVMAFIALFVLGIVIII